MLNWTKPGPVVLTGVLGLRLPIITRGVVPKKSIVPFQTLLVFCLFQFEISKYRSQLAIWNSVKRTEKSTERVKLFLEAGKRIYCRN